MDVYRSEAERGVSQHDLLRKYKEKNLDATHSEGPHIGLTGDGRAWRIRLM